MPNRHEELTQQLHAVQLHHTPAEVDALAERAAKEGLTHAALLYAFVQQEASYREQRRFARLLRESRLPRGEDHGPARPGAVRPGAGPAD